MAGFRFGVAAACAISLILLTGCTAAAIPVQTAPPELSTLTVTPNGIGDVAIGEPITSFALVNYGEHTCPTTGGWLPRYPRVSNTSSGQPLEPFDIVTRDGLESTAVTKEFIWSPAIATAKGVRVGSSQAAVEAAYPTAARSTSYSTTLFAVTGSRGRLVIEVARNNAFAKGEWPTATLGTVVWMQVLTRTEKVASIANSNDAGPCPEKGHVPDLDGD